MVAYLLNARMMARPKAGMAEVFQGGALRAVRSDRPTRFRKDLRGSIFFYTVVTLDS